jgi:hypothetical protein
MCLSFISGGVATCLWTPMTVQVMQMEAESEATQVLVAGDNLEGSFAALESGTGAKKSECMIVVYLVVCRMPRANSEAGLLFWGVEECAKRNCALCMYVIYDVCVNKSVGHTQVATSIQSICARSCVT